MQRPDETDMEHDLLWLLDKLIATLAIFGKQGVKVAIYTCHGWS